MKITKTTITIIRDWEGAKILIRDETKGVGNIIRTYKCNNNDDKFTLGIDDARKTAKAIKKQMNKEKISYIFYDKY